MEQRPLDNAKLSTNKDSDCSSSMPNYFRPSLMTSLTTTRTTNCDDYQDHYNLHVREPPQELMHAAHRLAMLSIVPTANKWQQQCAAERQRAVEQEEHCHKIYTRNRTPSSCSVIMIVTPEVLGPDAALTRERMRLEVRRALWGGVGFRFMSCSFRSLRLCPYKTWESPLSKLPYREGPPGP